MIADDAVLQAFKARRNVPCSRVQVARDLGIDDDSEFATQLAHLVKDELLRRWCHGTTWMYCLTPKGTRAVGGLNESTAVDNQGASPGVRASRTEAPEGNREKSSAASGISTIAATASGNRLPGEEGLESARRKPRADAADHHHKDDNMNDVTREAARQKIAAGLKNAADPMTVAEIGQLCQVGDAKLVRAALHDLAQEDKAHAEGHGRGQRWKAGPKRKARARVATSRSRRRPTSARRSSPAPAPVTPAPANADGWYGSPIASFSSKGEIVLTRADDTTVLSVGESREVISLVRAFDSAGLLPTTP